MSGRKVQRDSRSARELNCQRKNAFLTLVSSVGFLRKKVRVFNLAEKAEPRNFVLGARNLRANRARRRAAGR